MQVDGNRTRVLLAEDSPVVARQLRALLASECEVLGLVTDGEGVLGAVEALVPDVLVTDISMPGVDGLQAAEQALRAYPQLKVVFITVHDDGSVHADRARLDVGCATSGDQAALRHDGVRTDARVDGL